MANVIIAPGKYVQGSGELSRIGQYCKPLGEKFLVLITDSGKKRVGEAIEAGFSASGTSFSFSVFNGECSHNEINRLLEIFREGGFEGVVGVGGGKIVDTAKAVAHYAGAPVVIVPTIASTDAPCSALSVIYTDEGVFEEYLMLPKNPDIVLMDTAVIAKSPARLLAAGMGDALATYFEARAVKASGAGVMAGGQQTRAAFALAHLCLETLYAEGEKALAAASYGCVSPAVEAIIEANTLLSGLGFESGGLAAAHAIHNGFTVLSQCHHMYHGEKVAFGTIAQLVLENADMDEIHDVIHFCMAIGLPVTLEQLGITEIREEEIMAVAKAASAEGETIHNMPFPVTPEAVYAAILVADKLGSQHL